MFSGDVAKTLKTLKLDLMTELPRNKKTREPLIDSGQVERRLLQEVIDEIAGLDSLPVVVQTEAMNVDDGVALLPPAAPSFAARLTGERFAASISLNRDNITINEPPPPGIDLGVDEMPEATLDVLAGMGLFTGSLARPLYTKMIQQQLPSPLPEVLIGGPVEPHAIPTDVAPNLNAVVPNVPVANTPQLPDAEFIELEAPLDPRPSRRKLFESLSVEPPVASQQKRKPRHKPRRALHAQDEDAEKSKKNRPLIWHPAKPACQIHQQLSLHLIVAVFDGLEHYGEDDVEEPPREEERINEPPELPLIPPIDEGNRNRIPLSEMFQHEPVLPFPESSQHLPVPSLPETSQHQLVPPVPEIPQHQPVPSLPDLSQHQPVPPMPRDFEHYQTPKRRKVSLAENIRGESGEPRVSMPDPSTPFEKALVTSTPLLNPLTQLTDIDIDFGNYQLKSLQNLRQCAAPADPEVSSAMPKAAKHLQRFIQDGEQFLNCGGEDFSEYCLEVSQTRCCTSILFISIFTDLRLVRVDAIYHGAERDVDDEVQRAAATSQHH